MDRQVRQDYASKSHKNVEVSQLQTDFSKKITCTIYQDGHKCLPGFILLMFVSSWIVPVSPTLTLFIFSSDTHIRKTLSHFLSYVIYSEEIKLHFYKPVLPQMIAEDLLKKLIPDLLHWSILASTVLTPSFKTRWKQSNSMINFLVPAISYCSTCPRFQDWPPASLQNAQLLSLINHMNTFLITVIYYLLHSRWG